MAAAPLMREVAVRVPGDKSITHRAILFSTLAEGASRIRNALDSADTRSTAHVVRGLGARVPSSLAGAVIIDGRGLRGWTAPRDVLDCGNSGTTARLVMGALAGFPFGATLTGDASLQSRPMRRVTAPLTEMGATFDELGRPDRLPVRVQGGALSGIDYINAQSSAQVKSALLLAGLTGNAPVTVVEPRLSRDHTERMLDAMGATLHRSSSPDGFAVHIAGSHALQSMDISIPGDFSSAAFFVACGALTDGVEVVMENVGLNPGRIGMLDVLRRMNVVVNVSNQRMEANELVGDIRISRSDVMGVTIAPSEVPSLIDEIPAIAVLAARADGETRITGAHELRVKETDRIRALVTNLRAIGVEVDELDDGMVIQGTANALQGDVRAFGDHRIAMAFGVLGAVDGCRVRVDQPDVVDISFPDFWRALETVTGNGMDA
jgi:3-phosphoshikimate 1-carboxyvinyltransferase